MQAIKMFLVKIKDKVHDKIEDVYGWVRGKYRAHRKKCLAFWIIFGALCLLAGLIVGSYKSVSSVDQGAPINYTSGTILDQTVSNFGSFLGLNTYYKTIPRTNMLFSFNTKQKSSTSNSFDSITARVIQGTKLQIQVYAQVRIQTDNLKTFFQNYGIEKVDGDHQGWQIYIKQKIRNVVTLSVATFKFYEISNKKLSTTINTILQSYQTTTSLYYPFIIRIIGINIHYPFQTINLNDTLGIKLLEKKTLLSQLQQQLVNLNSYVAQYSTSSVNYALRNGEIDGTIAGREYGVKIGNLGWIEGVKMFYDGMKSNATLTQKYLQTYFNRVYNATYRIQSLQPFKI